MRRVLPIILALLWAAPSYAVILSAGGGGGGGADSTPPYTASFNPPNAQAGVSQGTTSAVFHILDDGNGVDNTTIQVTRTGGLLNTCGDNLVCTGAVGNITVTYPGLSLSYGDNVSFQIGASDTVPNAMDNVSYWFKVQSTPVGGTLLVGDNTYGDNNVNVSPNQMYTTDYTALVSGTANTIWVYYVNTASTNCKAAIYVGNTYTGAMLDNVIIPVSGTGWKSGTLAGGVSIVSGTKYRLGVICNGYELIGSDSTGADRYCTTGTYTSPPDPNCTAGSINKNLNVYITD